MISPTQIDHWAWLQRIIQKGYSSKICRRLVIISGLTFFIVHNLMAIYDRYWESQDVTTIQLELPRCLINKDQIDASQKEKRKYAKSG